MNNEQLIMNNDGMLFCEKLLFDSSTTVQQCIPKSFIIHHSSFITQPQGGC